MPVATEHTGTQKESKSQQHHQYARLHERLVHTEADEQTGRLRGIF